VSSLQLGVATPPAPAHASAHPHLVTTTTYPPTDHMLAVRTANEGVPVKAIARILHIPYDRVIALLNRALRLGEITSLPKTDWPIGHARTALATSPSPLGIADLEFLCRQTFRLTNLEAGFLAVLLRCLFAEKEKLHAVVEAQRASRQLRPAQPETTDPKMVDVMICKLRRKLALADPAFVIRTSWGKGYFLDPATKTALLARMAPDARTRLRSKVACRS